MARYGFVIDHRKCIGCHACTVACKMENRVPLGVFRTWVKYVERGTFPDTTRSFSVLRCNQCENAPCVAICPTKSLFRREDGIVDFDSERCIGCKSCMQACPYDALYIDPETLTAAKCNFCAHRVERDLAPACEIVCPTHAIVSGDLEDPSSQVAVLVREQDVAVRAPEQGTGPSVFYVGADGAGLTPEATKQAEAYLWSAIVPDAQTLNRDGDAAALAREATTVYNVAHPPMWGWKVSSYLVTKSVSAGVAGIALLALAFGLKATGALGAAAPILAFALAALTGYLLVWDLKHPERFLFIFLKPNPRSWLVLGAWALSAFCGALIGWAVGDLGGPAWMRTLGIAAAVPLAPLAAGYSGFLFNQAEGRDLWQSPLLHLHLVVMAAAAGAAALALLAAVAAGPKDIDRFLAWALVATSAAHGLLLALEYGKRHATENARTAARNLLRGPFAGAFRWGAGLAVGAAVAGAGLSLATGVRPLLWLGAACSLAGIWLYEDAWIRAGQSAPLS